MMKRFLLLVFFLVSGATCFAQYAERLHFEPFPGVVVNDSGSIVYPSEFSAYLDESAASMCSHAFKQLKWAQYASIGCMAAGTVGLVSGTCLILDDALDLVGQNHDSSHSLAFPSLAVGVVGFYSAFGLAGIAILNTARLRYALSDYYSISLDSQQAASLTKIHHRLKTCSIVGASLFAAGTFGLGLCTAFPNWDIPQPAWTATIAATTGFGLASAVCAFCMFRTERQIRAISGQYPGIESPSSATLSFGPTPSGFGLALSF